MWKAVSPNDALPGLTDTSHAETFSVKVLLDQVNVYHFEDVCMSFQKRLRKSGISKNSVVQPRNRKGHKTRAD